MVATVTSLNTAELSARLLDLFRDVPADLISHHSALFRLRDVADGEIIAGPDSLTDTVWGVLEGGVERRRADGRGASRHSARPGETVGLAALLSRSPPEETLVASGPSRLLEIPGEVIQNLADRSHRFSTNLLEALIEHRPTASHGLPEASRREGRVWMERRFSRAMRRCELTGFFVSLIVVAPDGYADGREPEKGLIAGINHMVRDQLRPYDLTAALDHARLAVLCIETRARDTVRIAERIRTTLRDGIGAGFTVSIGVVEMLDGESAANLISAGEEAAAEASRTGGDAVVLRARD